MALASWLAVGCATDAAGPAPPVPVPGPWSAVVVEVDPSSAVHRLEPEAAGRLSAWVSQSAGDWLEATGALATEGPVLEIRLDELSIRPGLAVWLWPWAVGPDRLGAQVRVREGKILRSQGRVRVESALAGRAWQEPTPRLERLARRLGRRVVQSLTTGPELGVRP